MIEGKRYTFGVSGLLYKRNLLMFDRETDSLWSQLLARAVTGPLAGTSLRILPAENTTWGEWKKFNPQTLVISFVTGYARNYREDPYADYPLPRHPALLVVAGSAAKIFPFAELRKLTGTLRTEVGGLPLAVEFDRPTETARVKGAPGVTVTHLVASLADLKAFHPEAGIYKHSH